MLTVHHLGVSQSERIVWLCEELGLSYELKVYDRDAVTRLAPPDYKALHPLGAAPVIEDGGVVLAESGAIVDYIIAKYGKGRLVLVPDHPDFAQFLYWFHFANGTLQPATGRNMILGRLDLAADNPVLRAMKGRLDLALGLLETRLGQADYLAGPEVTTADIMAVFTLTTMRYFLPYDLAPYPAILTYLQRIAARPAYQRAMQKGDPGMPLLLT
ncbi:MAG: glutathione S-transferase [Rhodospirillales bacterium]|jgi:glutathione S-transferase|nr:glutathione S-transferase [Rhodospirillales bacterium]